MTRACAVVLAASVLAGCSASNHRASSPTENRPRTLARLHARLVAVALDGDRVAWLETEGLGCVRAGELDHGRVIRLPKPRRCFEAGFGSLALAGRSALWAAVGGGNMQTTAVLAGSVGRKPRLYDEWVNSSGGDFTGSRFGGMAGSGAVLVYSRIDYTTVNESACATSVSVPCVTRVVGGGTYVVDARSLRRRRVLPAARAVATDGTRVAAAYARRVVVASRAASVTLPIRGAVALALAGRRLAALQPAAGGLDTVSLWDLRTRTRLRQVTVAGVALRKLGLAGSVAVVASSSHFALVDLASGRRRLVRVSHGRELVDFAVGRSRLVWAEKRVTVPEGIIRSFALVP